MAKLIRLWGKKRGGRMSGWWVVGSVSEAAFYGLLFLLGIVSLTTVVTWRVFWPKSSIFEIGFGFWLMVIASSSFVLIGLTALILKVSNAMASPELRSALVDKAKREHQRRADGKSNLFPSSLPNPKLLQDSPGVRLAYRLAALRADTAKFTVSAVFAVAWNSMLAVLLVIDIQKHLSGRSDWFLTLLLIPFATVSFFATKWFFRLFIRHTGVGPTTIEISDLPLLPGKEYALYLLHYVRVTSKNLSGSLDCSEANTYQQGTAVLSDRCAVVRQVLICHWDCRM